MVSLSNHESLALRQAQGERDWGGLCAREFTEPGTSLLRVAVVTACSGAGEALRQAPDFEVTLFDGSHFRLSDEVGKRAAVTRGYQVVYFPTTIFIDRAGRTFKTELSILDAEEIAETLREMSPSSLAVTDSGVSATTAA